MSEVNPLKILGSAKVKHFSDGSQVLSSTIQCLAIAQALLSKTSSQFQTQAREKEWQRLRSTWETSPTTRENGKFVLGIKCHTWSSDAVLEKTTDIFLAQMI